jgi:hypothetical protein
MLWSYKHLENTGQACQGQKPLAYFDSSSGMKKDLLLSLIHESEMTLTMLFNLMSSIHRHLRI